MGVLLRLELARLLRSRALVAAGAIWLVAAAGSLVHGHGVIERQRRALAESDALQAEHHAAILSHQPPTAVAADQLYYLTFHTRHEPSPWAALSVGQRDERSFNLKIRMLALHGQLYDADITSPLLAALGAFDFAFVLIALAPLLVIAVCHDVVSSEREAGTWPLVRAEPVSALRMLALKLGVRFGVVAALVVATTAAAPLLVGAPLDARVAIVPLVAFAYLAVWAMAAAVVALAGRASDVNALVMLGLWVLWVVVGPALVTTAGAARFPTPEALELTVQQRHGYHGSWDRPVAETMAAFYARYPQWKDVPVPTDRYTNAWYYAMQQRGDDAAATAAAGYFETLRARHGWVAGWWPLLPPALVQAALDRTARTDLPAHLGYLESVAAYHERIKQHFFPIVFNDAPISAVDWQAAPRHDHRDDGAAGDLTGAFGVLAVWVAAAAVLVTARRANL